MTIHRKTDDGRMIEITEEEAAAFAENMGEEMGQAKVMVEGCCYAAETMIPSLPVPRASSSTPARCTTGSSRR